MLYVFKGMTWRFSSGTETERGMYINSRYKLLSQEYRNDPQSRYELAVLLYSRGREKRRGEEKILTVLSNGFKKIFYDPSEAFSLFAQPSDEKRG